jgi:hypothetical protein
MYMLELVYYKTKYRDGTESYSEAFDPTQQRQVRFKRKARRKQTELVYKYFHKGAISNSRKTPSKSMIN